MRSFRPMGWGYRKRKKLLPGVDLNVGKRGLGLSFGRRGARLSVSSRGRKGVSLGWKGFFWRKRI
jgi:hypothetical protein